MNHLTPAAPKAAITYARTARRNPYRLDFLTLQTRLYAATHGYNVVQEFADFGVPATTLNRPSLRKLCAYVAEHEVDTCVMAETTALGRTIPVMLGFMTQLQACGIRSLILLDTKDRDGAPTVVNLDDMIASVRS